MYIFKASLMWNAYPFLIPISIYYLFAYKILSLPSFPYLVFNPSN
jgi:hypothetical protein